jgi:hypothetical protein
MSNAAVGNTIYNQDVSHWFYAVEIFRFKILFYFPFWFYFHEVLETEIYVYIILETSVHFTEKPQTHTYHPINISFDIQDVYLRGNTACTNALFCKM